VFQHMKHEGDRIQPRKTSSFSTLFAVSYSSLHGKNVSNPIMGAIMTHQKEVERCRWQLHGLLVFLPKTTKCFRQE
jgi:hypothetical protein